MTTKNTNRSNPSPFVSVATAAEILDLTDGRIRQLLGDPKKSGLNGIKLTGRSWMIHRDELVKYAKKNGIETKNGFE